MAGCGVRETSRARRAFHVAGGHRVARKSLVYPGHVTHDDYTRRNEPGCPFCEVPGDRMLLQNELAYAIRDAFPVTPLHTLVIPKRHIQSYFELDFAELGACNRLLYREKAAIEREEEYVLGFNVGVNDGEGAGQSMFHCHLHLIPRREQDVEDPRGGVRNVIPGRAVYP